MLMPEGIALVHLKNFEVRCHRALSSAVQRSESITANAQSIFAYIDMTLCDTTDKYLKAIYSCLRGFREKLVYISADVYIRTQQFRVVVLMAPAWICLCHVINQLRSFCRLS